MNERDLRQLVREMRLAQMAYFADQARPRDKLIHAKQLEKQVDDELREPQQTRLPLGT